MAKSGIKLIHILVLITYVLTWIFIQQQLKILILFWLMVQKVSDTYSFNMELIKNYRNFLIKLNAILIIVKSSIELTRLLLIKWNT